MSAGAIALHVLAQSGAADFRAIVSSRLAKAQGSHLNENSFYTALARMKRRKMIDKGGDGYELTKSGEWAALKAYVRHGMATAEPVPGAWDGKWRIVLFDFPESKRPLRDYTRNVLKAHGFREFQRSMWIWPYRLPAHLTKLFEDPTLAKHVRHITSSDINYDADLRKRFKLT